MLHICFITDSNYLIATMTAIESLILSNKKESLSVTVIGYQLTKSECEQILNLKTKKNKINIIDATEQIINIGKEHFYVSKCALLKFYLPIFFSNEDRILYLDGDILVKGNLKNFYLTEFEDKYAVVVKDIYATKSGYGKRLELDDYFNSGVMLLNLKKMRDDSITEQLIDYKLNKDPGPFMDQNAFNFIFSSKIVCQSLKYNYIPYVMNQFTDEEFINFYKINKKELYDIKSNPTIIHLAGFYKPWKCTFAEFFLDYMSYLYKLPKCEIKDLTLNYLLGKNKGMRLKYYLRQFPAFAFFIDVYLRLKLVK